MKLTNLLFIAILAIGIGACGGAATEQTNSDNKAETNTEKQEPVKEETKTEEPKKAETDDTPTKAIEEFAKAYEEKNLVRVKMRMSGKTLEVMAKDASAKGAKLDDVVTDFMNKTDLPFEGVPETRNEKIDGETATVEVKAGDKWVPMPLVLENDKWRIAFDKGKPGA